MSFALRVVLWLCALSCCWSVVAGENLGIQVPDGFEVSLYADDELAHDIYSMTVDAQGRVVVAGAGYVKILHDDNRDGRADRATLFSNVPASGAHGMIFDGPDLICTGDNSVMRLRDTDADGVADDEEPEIWTSLRHPEHGANGLVRGPDGCYYLICGNDAGVSKKQITVENSPVKNPRSGAVVRFSAQGKPLDVFAHGFRNPYDLDFDAAGRLFTVDSDGERDHHLPWYAPSRLFDIQQGAEHGWLLMGWARGWNRPQSFFDSVDRLVEIGRGSPTGVVTCRHRKFPEHYQGGVFEACWTLGRVYFFPLEPTDATYRSKLEIFMQTTGDVGFAPCDLAIGPDGDLFVAIGGRRTRGSVFRVRAKTNASQIGPQPETLAAVLSADLPLSSWSRANWVPVAKQLGKSEFTQALENPKLDPQQRVRAVEVLVEVFDGVDAATAARIAASSEPPVKARLAWALSRGESTAGSRQVLSHMTHDADAAVARAAWEALAVGGPLDSHASEQPNWSGALEKSGRRVRAAAIEVARGTGRASYEQFAATLPSLSQPPAVRLAHLWIRCGDADESQPMTFSAEEFGTCLDCFSAAKSDVPLQLEAVRLMQLGLGDVRTQEGQAEVYTGYVGNKAAGLDADTRAKIVSRLASSFPAASAELNRELARLFGMLGAGDDRLLPAIAAGWSDASTVEDDIHYLIVASLLRGDRSREITSATAQTLLRLHPKLDAQGHFSSRNWPLRVAEAFDELRERDPALDAAIVESPELGHADHALFVGKLPTDLRNVATRKLWSKLIESGDELTPELIALAGRLPEKEARDLLISQWESPGLRDSIVLALAKHPHPADREKFVEALSSPQEAVVQKAAQTLPQFGMDCTSAEMAVALRALKIACSLTKQTEPRVSLVRLLNFWTEENSDVDEAPDASQAYVPWFKMFADYYPAAAKTLNRTSGAGAESWKARLAAIDWTLGDSQRGRAVFERRACHRCHQVSGHLGPELKGAVARMSRDDLFAAIYEPNLEVSPAYQTTLIATAAGQVYHGLVVYESPESTLLQTGPDTTVRVLNAERESTRRSNLSLMPTGLLDPLSDAEISDLYSYLRTLGGP